MFGAGSNDLLLVTCWRSPLLLDLWAMVGCRRLQRALNLPTFIWRAGQSCTATDSLWSHGWPWLGGLVCFFSWIFQDLINSDKERGVEGIQTRSSTGESLVAVFFEDHPIRKSCSIPSFQKKMIDSVLNQGLFGNILGGIRIWSFLGRQFSYLLHRVWCTLSFSQFLCRISQLNNRYLGWCNIC